MSLEEVTKETLDRVRRIETRLTAYLVRNGESVISSKPVWDEDIKCVLVPTPDVSIAGCFSVVPSYIDEDVPIYSIDNIQIGVIYVKELREWLTK